MTAESFEKEMNRGFVQLLVLLLLERDMYGYELARELGERGYLLEENTLYPLLRRLEGKDILASRWDVTENKPRKYYGITPAGKDVRAELLRIWREQAALLESLLGGIDHD